MKVACPVLTMVVLAGSHAAAQERPAPPAGVAEAQARLWASTLDRWERLGDRVVAMARAFPQEKADFRFHPESRTFLEEVWHETFDQQMLEARLKGTQKTLDVKRLFSGEGRPRQLTTAADELESVLRASAALLRAERPSLEVMASLDFYIEHAGVTYGKLAAMYRANGLVPPQTVENLRRAAARNQTERPAPSSRGETAPPPGAHGGSPASTLDETLASQWDRVFRQIVEIARDFPEDRFGYRIHSDVRSFVEEIWHLTATAEWLRAAIRGEDKQLDMKALFSYTNRPRDRARLAGALEAAANDCSALLRQNANPRATAVLTHAAEAYGKLVSMYRANGLVPPVTKAAARRK